MRFLLAADQLGGEAQDLAGGHKEVISVFGISRCRGGHEPCLVAAVFVDDSGEFSQGVQAPLDGLGVKTPGLVDALP